ncbi:MAG TPA: hypothetical protein VFY67_14185 [Pyrinomonadaceae bacterium]|nr:hypothetical protein [Pyrinomonadaceae bacterium]
MRSKKFILLVVFLVLLLLSQIPFAYRRYKLRRLNAAVQQLNSQRVVPERHNGFVDYKGVVHVHSFLGGHSSGTFSEIISAAQANQLQFVVMTEHTEKDFDTAAMTLSGMHGGVLFLNGNEVSAANGDRFLALPREILIAAYPEEFKSLEIASVEGVEIYNVFTNAKQINPVVAFFDVLWSRRSYPELIFALYLQRPDENLKKWDQALATSRLTATAGNDAHANIGVSLKDSSGKTLLGIQLDPYETSFRLVRLHVLLEQDKPLDTPALLDAITAGHCFIGFDFLGDSSGFSFDAENNEERKTQGDEIFLKNETRLRVQVPVSSRIVLFKDGAVFVDESGISAKELAITERGVYRVEVYLPQLGNLVATKPWIISNPIYVR